MSRNQVPTTPATRRERREAARRAARTRPVATPRPAWRSPLVLITGGALLAGLLLIGAVQLLPKDDGASTAGADLLVPQILPAAELVDGRALGKADAPVTLTVWSDFQCPACKLLAREVEPRLIAEYVATGKLRIEYKDMIVIGPESTLASSAARCAEEQGRFWDFHAVLFANQLPENSGGITRERLVAMAAALKLDQPAFTACYDGGHFTTQVEIESASGRTRFSSTPTLDFGTETVSGVPSWETLSAKIDALVAAAGA